MADAQPAPPASEPAGTSSRPTGEDTVLPGSGSSRPLMLLLDLLGRRWVLRLLWELRNGRLTFGALRRAAGGLSQSVLTVRLRELKDADLVEGDASGGYRLTVDGVSLVREMSRLDRWAEQWAAGHAPPARGAVPQSALDSPQTTTGR